jgi:hypothetical protein
MDMDMDMDMDIDIAIDTDTDSDMGIERTPGTDMYIGITLNYRLP